MITRSSTSNGNFHDPSFLSGFRGKTAVGPYPPKVDLEGLLLNQIVENIRLLGSRKHNDILYMLYVYGAIKRFLKLYVGVSSNMLYVYGAIKRFLKIYVEVSSNI